MSTGIYSLSPIIRCFFLTGLFIIISGCNLLPADLIPRLTQQTGLPTVQNPLLAPTREPTQVATSTPWEPLPPTPQVTQEKTQPAIPENTPTPTITPIQPVTQLAYLQGGNLWILDFPGGQPKQLTQSGDILSYTWAQDGSLLVIFNGRMLCSLTTTGEQPGCIDLALSGTDALIPRQIVWSHDQSTLILWNPVNPWDEAAIGWIVVRANTKEHPWIVLDPVDWGASLSPDNQAGGVTGQAIFLNDNTLVGTVTHRWLCGSSGCHYKLYFFDLEKRSLLPYPNKPEEGFSEGAGLVLSKDGKTLVNYGSFQSGCDKFDSFVDLFSIETQDRTFYHLPQQSIQGLALSPDNQHAILALSAACNTEAQITWAQSCGLSQGLDVYNMQLWNLNQDQKTDLLPGTQPNWSASGNWLAFRSCLINTGQSWQPDSQELASIYILELTTNTLQKIAPGNQPLWKP